MVFEKNVEAVVRGIRANPRREAQYINEVLSEIKKELQSNNLDIKANAIEKLVYLEMIGYDMSWASFHVMSLLASAKFPHKRVGYLAAQQSYHQETDVLLLVCNSMKKDLTSPRYYEATLAMNGMAKFLTPMLGANLYGDVAAMINSSKPEIRKRALLLMYRMLLVYPEGLRPTYPRLKQKLDDPEPTVQSASVTVFYELAAKNPKSYIDLAPDIYKILQESQHTWMLIKCIKIFGALCPHEPRLAKKLAEPLAAIITNSSRAIALIYECIATVVKGGLYTNQRLLAVCVDKLNSFLEDEDLNLNYLGLTQMAKVIKLVPKVSVDRRHLVRACLRVKTLNLLVDVTGKKHCVDTVTTLLEQLDVSNDLHFRSEVVQTILDLMCSSNYKNVVNFDWFVSILIKLAQIEGHGHGTQIAKHFLDVAVRVKAIREEVTQEALQLITNPVKYKGGNAKDSLADVLGASAWIIGEFCRTFSDQVMVFSALMHPRIKSLPGHIGAVFLTSALKVYCSCARRITAPETSEADRLHHTKVLGIISETFVERLEEFCTNPDPEVQERACAILELLTIVKEVKDNGVAFLEGDVAEIFAQPLKPVAPKAQRKVPVPEGLDLNVPINQELASLEEDEGGDILDAAAKKEQKKARRRTKVAAKVAKQARVEEMKNNPHYIGSRDDDKKVKRRKKKEAEAQSEVMAGVARLDLGDLKLTVDDAPAKKDKKKKKMVVEVKSYDIEDVEEMPEGAVDSDEDQRAVDDPHAALALENLEAKVDSPAAASYRATDSAHMLKDKPKKKREKKAKKDLAGDMGSKDKSKKKTPSKEKVGPLLLLVQNDKVRVDYVVSCAEADPSPTAAVTLVIKNKHNKKLTAVKVDVAESPIFHPAKRDHAVGEVAVKGSQTIVVGGTITEYVKRQKVKGAVHYHDGDADKTLEFTITLLGTMLNVATELAQDGFTSLLAGGELGETTSIDFPAVGEFSAIVDRIGKVAHVKVVEQIELTASAYARNIFGKHVALLIKLQGKEVHIDSKSSGDVLAKTVLAEIKKHCGKPVRFL